MEEPEDVEVGGLSVAVAVEELAFDDPRKGT